MPGPAEAGRLRHEPCPDRIDRPVAGRVGKPGVDVKHLVEEILCMRCIFVVQFLLVVRNTNKLQKPGVVRVVDARGTRDFPETVHHLLAAFETAIGKIGVKVALLDACVPCLDRPGTRHPDRWTGFLQRTRPQVDIPQLGVLAVERKDLILFPRSQDQLFRLGVLLSESGRIDTVSERGVHRRTDREPCDKPAPADAVQHGKLFGHTNWRVVQGDRVAHHDNCHVLGLARHSRGHDVWRRHQAVRVLVVLVHADAVIPHLGSIFELVKRLVVGAVCDLSVKQVPGHVHPHAVVPLAEILRQVTIRAQMKHLNLHEYPFLCEPRQPVGP